MAELPFLSIVIPMHNSAATIEPCLQAACAVDYPNFEVVVIDDGSTDNSAELARKYDVQLHVQPENGGAGKARNAGAAAAKGEFIFFTDSDCVVPPDILHKAAKAIEEEGRDKVIGGSYTPLAHDHGLFNSFQSVFVNYSETKYRTPDYIATHAMLLPKSIFDDGEQFQERFLPILEDVDFCHRLRRRGIEMVMRPEILVGHIFRFGLWRSMRNAYRKSRWWTRYHLTNKDALTDSGTASFELKSNVMLWTVQMACWAAFLVLGSPIYAWIALGTIALSLLLSRKLIAAYLTSGGGVPFALGAILYYLFGYPIPVAIGSARGLMKQP
ncbi:MAG: glycosyltransferase family A protein [Planctomycetota bacterium]|nr:glycosyltransferase family A protein [Planctomycetota bacterium]